MAEKLSITLPAEMVSIIKARVQSGSYASTSEVLREAVRGANQVFAEEDAKKLKTKKR